MRVDAELGQDAEHRLLQIAHIAVQVTTVGSEIQNRIRDELAGSVVGDITATSGVELLDAEGCEVRPIHEHVRIAAGAADRHHVRMFEQEKLIRNLARSAPLYEIGLQCERLGIRYPAE